jgi:hypothetical protein
MVEVQKMLSSVADNLHMCVDEEFHNLLINEWRLS